MAPQGAAGGALAARASLLGAARRCEGEGLVLHGGEHVEEAVVATRGEADCEARVFDEVRAHPRDLLRSRPGEATH